MTETTPPPPTPTADPARAALAVQAILAIGVLVLFGGFLWAAGHTDDKGALLREVYADLRDVLLAVIFYYFGSSSGSKTKDYLRHG